MDDHDDGGPAKGVTAMSQFPVSMMAEELCDELWMRGYDVPLDDCELALDCVQKGEVVGLWLRQVRGRPRRAGEGRNMSVLWLFIGGFMGMAVASLRRRSKCGLWSIGKIVVILNAVITGRIGAPRILSERRETLREEAQPLPRIVGCVANRSGVCCGLADGCRRCRAG